MCSSKRHNMIRSYSMLNTWINQKPIYIVSIQNRCRQHQPNTNAHYINPKSMLIAQISFWLDSLVWKLSHFAVCLWPVILSGAEGEVAEPILPKDNPCSPGEGWPSQTVGEVQTKTLSHTPHPFGVHLLLKEKVFLRLLKQWILQLRASPACRMTWGWGERLGKNQSIKVCNYKQYKMNCLGSSSKTWINQKSICLASIQSRYIEHQPNTNAFNINPKPIHRATIQNQCS